MRKKIQKSIFLLALSAGAASLGAIDDTGTAGLSITLDSASAVRVSEGLTGSGALTLTTTGATLNDGTTYGTFQFQPNASLSQFTGSINLKGARLDLNGNNLSASTINAWSQTVDNVATYDRASRILNTGANKSTLTLTGNNNFYAALGNTDGSNSNVELVWNTTGSRYVCQTQYHTGGSTFTGGTLGLVAADEAAAQNMLGSGDIKLNGINLNVQQNRNYALDNNVEITGIVRLRMQSAAKTTFNGDISGVGELHVAYDGGQITLNGQNSYSGKTVVGDPANSWKDNSSKANLQLGHENALPTGTTLEMNNLFGGSYLYLNGFNQTVARLCGGGSILTTETPAKLTVGGAVSGNFSIGNKVSLSVKDSSTLNLEGDGTLELREGASINVPQTLSCAKIQTLGDAAISAIQASWGKTVFSTKNDYSSSAEPTFWQTHTDELHTTDNSVFPNNTTMSFIQTFDVSEETQLSFFKNFDDSGAVYVTPVNDDGTYGERQTVLYDTTYNSQIFKDVTLAPGRYVIEIRAGQGSGGVGPTNGKGIGIGIKAGPNGTLDSIATEYSKPTICDDRTLSGISTIKAVPTSIEINSNIAIAPRKTLELTASLDGSIRSTNSISGEGSKVVLNGSENSTIILETPNSWTGGTTVNVANLSLGCGDSLGTGDVTFNSASTVTLDGRTTAYYQPWHAGAIVQSSADNQINKTLVPDGMTWTAEAEYLGKSPGDYTTRVYQASNLVSNEDFTMYFGKMYDDNAYLKITDATTGVSTELFRDSVWNEWVSATYDFQKDHRYSIDLRVYNGSGGAGPVPENNNTSGMPQGVGIGVSLNGFTENGKGDSSFVIPNFDSEGHLAGSPLQSAYANFVFNQNFILNQNVTFDAVAVADGVTFNGIFNGNGKLTLKNGDFRLNSNNSQVGGFSLENASWAMTAETGIMNVQGELEILDSSISVNLNGLSENWTGFNVSGNVSAKDTDWIFTLDAVPENEVQTVTLISGNELNTELWRDFAWTIDNPNLRGILTSDANGLYLSLGSSTALPEPSAWLLLLTGCGLFLLNRKKKKG